jgi:hypothetical protein
MLHQEVLTASNGEQDQAHPAFILPTSGFLGWPYTGEAPTYHNGIDIWTGDPRASRKDDKNPSGCQNDVRVAYPGTVYAIKKTVKYTNAPTPNDKEASIIVIKHQDTGPEGLPKTFYTWYLHMGKNDGTGTCIASEVWDRLLSSPICTL